MTSPPEHPAISETVSEKRTRGRPPAFDAPYLETADQVKPGMTRRTHVDYLRAIRAMQTLQAAEQDGEFGWLLADWRQTVLTELGRVTDPDLRVAAARRICALQPATSTEAVRLVRRWRVGTQPGSVAQLVDELTRHLDAYRDRHPDTTAAMLLDALDDVREAVELVDANEQQEPPLP